MYTYIKKYVPYLFLLPSLVFFSVFFFLPLLQTIFYGFFDFSSSIYSPNFVFIDNYKYLFHSKEFLKALTNTFIFMLIVVPFLTIFPLFLAILLNQKIKFSKVYRFFIYLPVIISIVVVAIAFKWLYSENGFFNYILSLFNLPKLGFLTNPKLAMFSVGMLTIFKGVGYYMMIYFSSLVNAPKDLYEASKIDGANPWQMHIAVTLPYILPTTALVCTISSISALKAFVEIYVLTKGGPLDSTKTLVYYIYQKAFENLDIGIASAASFVLLVFTLGLSVLNVLVFEREKYKL